MLTNKLKHFYKIENNKLKQGSGYRIPSGFIEYEKGQEPQELLDILSKEEFSKTKKQVLNSLKTKIQFKITSGFIFGDDIIKTDDIAQRNGNANYNLAVTAMQKAKDYATSTTYNSMDIILDNGIYYITFNGGKTSDTKPDLSTDFQVEVVDNEVSWYKFGLLVSTKSGNKYFTPQDVESMYIQFNLMTTELRKKYDEYKNKIEAVTSIDDLNNLKTEIEAL